MVLLVKQSFDLPSDPSTAFIVLFLWVCQRKGGESANQPYRSIQELDLENANIL